MARLLALSGGGSWSLIQTRALATLFPGQSGRAILSQFDLVAGTSGGVIVLAGLLGDMTLGAITQMFLDPVVRAQLYVPVDGPASLAAAFGAGPKWSSAGKLAGLQALLGPTGAAMLSGVPVRVAMPAYDVDSHCRMVFRSYGIPGSAAPATTVALAAHASSIAPVAYFDAPAAIGGLRLWDGGVAGLTCPDMLAVRDALELGLGDLRVLSLGSATVWRPRAGPGMPAALAA
ncbi:MAG: patatin-like phospholipase family protein [Janthinobacterium lividum]